MLQIDHMDNTAVQDIRIACAYLFTPDQARDDDFIKNLAPVSVERSFREKTLRYDPELHSHEPEDMLQKRRERLVKIESAYQLLKAYVENDLQSIQTKSALRRKVIAIGGAKGGIGKSMLAANLSVLLSNAGKRVVLMDLDLGGANLHLYMGGLQLSHTLHDYLNKSIPALQNVMSPTEHGPLLIGGNSSQLGAANIHFSKKLKLIRAVNLIDADHVIIDLGGDTSYNNIDFFLAADCGIVLTTCDPAAYLEAYNFIKIAVLRKLSRLFGPENDLHLLRVVELEDLIQSEIQPDSGRSFKSVDHLLRQIEERFSEHLPLVRAVLSSLQLNLVVNQSSGQADADQVVRRIQEVSRKMLSIEVDCPGQIGFQPSVQQSAQKLIPAVADHPEGEFVDQLKIIARSLKLI